MAVDRIERRSGPSRGRHRIADSRDHCQVDSARGQGLQRIMWDVGDLLRETPQQSRHHCLWMPMRVGNCARLHQGAGPLPHLCGKLDHGTLHKGAA